MLNLLPENDNSLHFLFSEIEKEGLLFFYLYFYKDKNKEKPFSPEIERALYYLSF